MIKDIKVRHLITFLFVISAFQLSACSLLDDSNKQEKALKAQEAKLQADAKSKADKKLQEEADQKIMCFQADSEAKQMLSLLGDKKRGKIKQKKVIVEYSTSRHDTLLVEVSYLGALANKKEGFVTVRDLKTGNIRRSGSVFVGTL